MKELTFKEALIAHLQGEKVEVCDSVIRQWGAFGDAFRNTPLGTFDKPAVGLEFRLAPATISINGVEIEAPFVPEDGEECWCFNMMGGITSFIAGQEVVLGTESLIRNGNCFRTREAAKAAFEAVSKALKGGV